MELTKIIENAGPIVAALGLRELIPWLIKRHTNKGRNEAQIEKLRAETKSTEIAALSSVIEQLSNRIDVLEQDVREIQAAERECQKQKKEIMLLLEEYERKERARAYAGISKTNGHGEQ